MKMKYLPNCITIFRILATCCMVFLDVFSIGFYILYALAGFSDVLDGWIARRWKLTSEAGAKLDSIADIMYYIVMVVMIYPVLLETLPIWIWCMIAVAVVLRLFSYGMVAVKSGQLASLHTYLNKLTGLFVFLLPFIIKTKIAVGYCATAAGIAILAAVDELTVHIKRQKKEVKSS